MVVGVVAFGVLVWRCGGGGRGGGNCGGCTDGGGNNILNKMFVTLLAILMT